MTYGALGEGDSKGQRLYRVFNCAELTFIPNYSEPHCKITISGVPSELHHMFAIPGWGIVEETLNEWERERGKRKGLGQSGVNESVSAFRLDRATSIPNSASRNFPNFRNCTFQDPGYTFTTFCDFPSYIPKV